MLHWQNPASTPIMWLAIVYSMLVISLRSFKATGDEPHQFSGQIPKLIHKYRQLAAQCINTVGITAPHLYTVEALVLYIIGEFGRTRDSSLGIVYEVSLVVRIATVMGYHSDPGSYSAFTPFTPFVCEMRRRVWCTVRQLDLLFASRLGLQPIIRPESTNAQLPRNIFDDELTEDMSSLPTSRPLTEPTPICYVIYRFKLLSVFGKVWEGMQLGAKHSFESAMNLDAELNDTLKDIPPHLKMRPIEESLRDTPLLVVQRYALDLLFLCTKCILHRPFINFSRDDPKYEYSRKTAIDASMKILEHQATVHREGTPGGRLGGITWFNNFLTTHDFQLGAMIISLELYAIAKEKHADKAKPHMLHEARNDVPGMIAALEQASLIWESLSIYSAEAYKAHAMLEAILDIFQGKEGIERRKTRAPKKAAVAMVPSDGIIEQTETLKTMGNMDSSLTQNHPVPHLFSNMGGIQPNVLNQTSETGSATTTSTSSGHGFTPSLFPGEIEDMLNRNTNNPSTFFNMFDAFPNMDMQDADIDWVCFATFLSGLLRLNQHAQNSLGADCNPFSH